MANDELKKPEKDKFYILNLENHDEGGTHWTLLWNHHYYDSFGCVPTRAIGKFVKDYSTDDVQSLTSSACGYFCIYAGDNIIKGLDPYHGLTSDPAKNEKILQRYFSS